MRKFHVVVIFVLIGQGLPAQAVFFQKLSDAALTLTRQKVEYNSAYVVIPYPNGDVPSHTGVCTDVIIRAYRLEGIDLQREVHEDMVRNFERYPKIWGLKKPDKNIDHRRVPNLITFFSRHGVTLKTSNNPDEYLPGDIVTWNLPGNLPHIGIVVNRKSTDGQRNLIVHNIGNGQEISDCLFQYVITGHYRYSK
ncbi:MAG: DUF1287 domain-containing protein [Cyclobacteriaceae bacterium]